MAGTVMNSSEKGGRDCDYPIVHLKQRKRELYY